MFIDSSFKRETKHFKWFNMNSKIVQFLSLIVVVVFVVIVVVVAAVFIS